MEKNLRRITLLTFLSLMVCASNSTKAADQTSEFAQDTEENQELQTPESLLTEINMFKEKINQIGQKVSDEQIQQELALIAGKLNELESKVSQPDADLNEISQNLKVFAQNFSNLIAQSDELKVLVAEDQ